MCRMIPVETRASDYKRTYRHIRTYLRTYRHTHTYLHTSLQTYTHLRTYALTDIRTLTYTLSYALTYSGHSMHCLEQTIVWFVAISLTGYPPAYRLTEWFFLKISEILQRTHQGIVWFG